MDEHEISEHFTNSGWVCFAGKMPANNKLYTILFKRMREEQGLLIQQEKKSWMQQGLNL
jgi:hypothetical protein